MVTIRRAYIFLVCAVSLHATTWAVITLLRNLLPGVQAGVTALAFQIAVIVIGLPVFLVHWLWAQGLARRNLAERESALRRLYLYGTLALLLVPFLANAYDLVANVTGLAVRLRGFAFFSPTAAIGRDLAAMFVLAALWVYHQSVVAAEARAQPEAGASATVRRLYVYGFSAAGVTMVTLAVIDLVRWFMFQLAGSGVGNASLMVLTAQAQLVVGLPLWLIFWGWGQRLFYGPGTEEREAALRKFYLYATVTVGVLSVVTNATAILAGVFRRLLSLPSSGNLGLPLPIIVGTAGLWAYHAYQLQRDAALAAEAPRQADIRRLYLYLVAAIGLGAFLVGLAGDISVLIRGLAGSGFGRALAEQLAWFTAALIAGLPVWLLPWRRAQLGAVAPTPAGSDERRSVVRKIYLYFFLFVATMTVLSGAVYIVFRLLSVALGGRAEGNLLADLAQAIAYTLIGVGVWLYHGAALRGDGRINSREQGRRLADMRVAVVDVGEGSFGRSVLDGLRRALPDLALDLVTLPAADGATGEAGVPAALAAAGLIVGPWSIAVAGGAGGQVPAEVAQAVVASAAAKVLAPVPAAGWEWAGVDRWNTDALVQQTVRAVEQLVAGEEVKPVRPMSAGAIIGLVVLGLIVLSLGVIPLQFLFGF